MRVTHPRGTIHEEVNEKHGRRPGFRCCKVFTALGPQAFFLPATVNREVFGDFNGLVKLGCYVLTAAGWDDQQLLPRRQSDRDGTQKTARFPNCGARGGDGRDGRNRDRCAARCRGGFSVRRRHLTEVRRRRRRSRLVEGLAMPREEDEFKLRFYNTLSTWIGCWACLGSAAVTCIVTEPADTSRGRARRPRSQPRRQSSAPACRYQRFPARTRSTGSACRWRHCRPRR